MLTDKVFFTVGGLGLNLTSADTLIFMEHDWNPMRDHQVAFCKIIDMLALMSYQNIFIFSIEMPSLQIYFLK